MNKPNMFKREINYVLLLLPALLIYCTFFIIPTLKTALYSFTNWSDVHPVVVKFVGLDNYIALFKESIYLTGIRNTLIYAVLAMLGQNILAIPLAVFLNKKLKTKNLLRAAFFLPAVFSVLVIGYLWNFMYSPSDFGLINQLVVALGFERINFLGDPHLALYSVIIASVWQWVGYTMVIYLANLQSISTDYYEAAKIDRASGIQMFRYITLPLLLPAITFNTVMGMINGMKVFDIVYALTGGGPGYSTETIVSLMLKKGLSEGFYSYGAAFGIVFVILVGIITFIHISLIKMWERR
ncbi:sugar ABC transporter permease [Paenibacillus terrigena]|uniref:carbohydrate ABC transporter permease n=1 Tax=Paenibacillus terrigena TaxID=369333 RepID=UPI0028D6D9C9|nr:sugar ABC transporter permease [Paenibacillus terrigena]